jgi:hypothetical protein
MNRALLPDGPVGELVSEILGDSEVSRSSNHGALRRWREANKDADPGDLIGGFEFHDRTDPALASCNVFYGRNHVVVLWPASGHGDGPQKRAIFSHRWERVE